MVPIYSELITIFLWITINVNEMNLEFTTHDAGKTSEDNEHIERLDEKIRNVKLIIAPKYIQRIAF